MSKSTFTRRVDSQRPAGPRGHIAGALSWLGLGLWALWQHHVGREPVATRPALAVLLLVIAGGQLRWLWVCRRQPQALARPAALPGGLLARWGFLLAVAGYALLVLPAPPALAPWILAAWLAGLHSLWLASSGLTPPQTHGLLQLLRRPVLYRAGQLALVCIVVLVAAELALRADGLFRHQRFLAARASHRLKLPAGALRAGRQINALGYWDQEFEPRPRPGRFRIAVLGDERTLSGTVETNFLADTERQLPGIEIYHFGLPTAGPQHYLAQLADEVLDFQPALVLVCLALEDDIIGQSPAPSCAEWQGLRLWDWACRRLPHESAGDLGTWSAPRVHRGEAQRLAICRSPIEAALRPRWQATFRALAALASNCRQCDVPLALVLIPASFQVDPVACEHLRHQVGYTTRELDLQLPQRRLTAFAQQQQIAVLDLLPSLTNHTGLIYDEAGSNWNDAAHRCAANTLARWLHRQYGPRWSALVQTSTSSAPNR